MKAQPKKSRLLVIGADPEDRARYRGFVRSELRKKGSWEVEIDFSTSVDDVVQKLGEQPDLQIIFIRSGFETDQIQAHHDVHPIVQAIAGHQEKPWVLLDPDIAYLGDSFELFDIKVLCGHMVADVVHDRWTHKTAQAAT